MQIPPDTNVSSPLGALISHFNSSSQSVKKSFAKLFAEYKAREAEQMLMERIERGEAAIRNGQGISKHEGETTEDFMDRLCTM